jgi:Ca2+-binding RTX toxin-like protein
VTPTPTSTPSSDPCGEGQSECSVSSAACTILGTAGNDVLTGSPLADVICGLGGDDTIDGEGGDDTLIGGDGHDTLTGGPGTDCFVPGQGDDTLTDRQPGEPLARPGDPVVVSPDGTCHVHRYGRPGGSTQTVSGGGAGPAVTPPQVSGPVSVGAAFVTIARLAAAQTPSSSGAFPVTVLPRAHVDRGVIKEVVLCTRPVSGRLVFRTAGRRPRHLLGRQAFSCSSSSTVTTHLRTRPARRRLRRSGRLKATVLVIVGAQRRRFPVLLVTP